MVSIASHPNGKGEDTTVSRVAKATSIEGQIEMNTPNEIVYQIGNIRVVKTWIGHREVLAYFDVEQFERGYWKSRVARLFGNHHDAVARANLIHGEQNVIK